MNHVVERKIILPELEQQTKEFMRDIAAKEDLRSGDPVLLMGDVIKARQGAIDIYPYLKIIAAYTTRDFDLAIRLGEVYNRRIGDEFVILDYRGGIQDDT